MIYYCYIINDSIIIQNPNKRFWEIFNRYDLDVSMNHFGWEIDKITNSNSDILEVLVKNNLYTFKLSGKKIKKISKSKDLFERYFGENK